MSKEPDSYWICFCGDERDFEAGRGSLHYVDDRWGKRCLIIFSTRKKAERFIDTNLGAPKAHMEMLESARVSHLAPLTAGRFSVAKVDNEDIIELALEAGIDYLQRDIRPGKQQEVLRLDR